jgi:uncharacterized membrane protein YhfC
MTIFSLIFRILNAALMLGIPLALAVILINKSRESLRTIGIGAAGFILSQLGHIPFNSFLLMPGLKRLGMEGSPQGGAELLLLGIAAGISAGLFEEFTRFLIFRGWLSKTKSTLLPIQYGVGHGGIEAFSLGVIALVALIQVLVLGGNGALDSLPLEEADLIRSQITAYWEISFGYSLLGVWERISALAFHLGASILVYRSVREKNPRYLLIAFIGHVMIDAFAVVAVQSMDYVLLESILFVFAAGWFYMCWALRFVARPAKEISSMTVEEPRFMEPIITEEGLEESRYDER